MRIYFLLLVVILFAISCKQKDEIKDASNAIDIDSLANDIRILASDEFEGRKPFTPGETKTINYIKNSFAAIGLEPGNGNSYFQEVPMVSIATEPDLLMKVQSQKSNFNLEGFKDYVIWTEKTDSVVSLKNDEVVFAGYGVVAPEYQWNDYAGIDVKGKIVLVLINDPGYGIDKSLFKGDTMTYYGRWTYKFEEAARQGAKGCLIIHKAKAASYPFDALQNNWKGSRLRLDDRNKPQKYCSVIGWISEDASNKLLAAANMDTTIFSKASKKGFRAMPLNINLSTKINVNATYIKTNNVIAKITGTKHPDQYIIYSAHWDHLGIGKPDETGDSIYNGAIDNATGTAGLLQLARMYKGAKEKPERTIVFLAVTAEEQGLWGSAYYAYDPVYPLLETLANINMDGLNIIGKTKDITVVGEPQSDLEVLLKNEAERSNRHVVYSNSPEAGHYYRSDHFNFAKVGVPALYAGSGTKVVGKDESYGLKWKERYGAKDYHRTSDEYNADKWKLDGALEDLNLLYNVGRRIAASEKWPQWNADSEFKPIREKSLREK